MRRREFIAGVAGAATWPIMARAQQPALPVVGFVSLGSADASGYGRFDFGVAMNGRHDRLRLERSGSCPE
jgi:hypothetical protein